MTIVALHVVLNDYGGTEIVRDSLKQTAVDILCIAIHQREKKPKNRSFVDVFV